MSWVTYPLGQGAPPMSAANRGNVWPPERQEWGQNVRPTANVRGESL